MMSFWCNRLFDWVVGDGLLELWIELMNDFVEFWGLIKD